MSRNFKVLLLLAVAAAAMAALVVVNLQTDNDGRPRRPGITAPDPGAGPQAGAPPGRDRWAVYSHGA